MSWNKIYDKILDGIEKLPKCTCLRYISGQSYTTFQSIDRDSKRILATRNEQIVSIPFEHVEQVAREFAEGRPVHFDSLFQSGGNTRTVLETLFAHLPNVEWLKIDRKKHLSWSEEELHEIGTIHESTYLSRTITEDIQLDLLFPSFYECLLGSRFRVNESLLIRLLSALLSKQFILLTGLSGSGKTKLAQAFSAWITPESIMFDPFKNGIKIQSDRKTYYIKYADERSIEFWNSSEESETTKVTLPREMINEWAEYIEVNNIVKNTPAREIREFVKVKSKFSDQLHSFETHLKAAAFTLVDNRSTEIFAACSLVIPVGADWIGNENVLGYPNGLEKDHYVSQPALELILQAIENPKTPHFLILDEMNLSHIERYFADFLSAIESGEGIPLYDGRTRTTGKRDIPRKLHLPKNLFVIGTVNVDETTYMFSPKVLDRANVIEFRMQKDEMQGFLDFPSSPDLGAVAGQGSAFGEEFVRIAGDRDSQIPFEVQAQFKSEVLLFFNLLQQHNAEFGYRVSYEAARFVAFYKLLGGYKDDDPSWFDEAMDAVIVQKFLPKLHGSRAKLGPMLKKLWFLCANDMAGRGADALNSAEEAARSTDKKAEPSTDTPADALYPVSAEKIGRMWRLLIENGFASFAEA